LKLRPLSLRTRLSLSAALAIAVVVGGTSYLQDRITARAVEGEALDAAAATALGIAADLTEREAVPTAAELEDMFGQYVNAVPAVRAVTVVGTQGARAEVEVSTESRPAKDVLALAERASRKRALVTSLLEPGDRHFVAVPLERQGASRGAVVVAFSTEAVRSVQRQTRTTVFGFAAVVIVVLAGAIDLVGRRLVHRPLEVIRDTIRRATAGDLQARALMRRADELGTLADGLNAMLDRMGDFNAALRQEVERATRDLRESNRQLVETAQRLFMARRELARTEQLAVAGQMAASVAHQIGTPLNLISGYVQMILADLPKTSRPTERLLTVQEQIRKVATIVQGLLDQARRPAPQKSSMAPAELLCGIAELVRPTLEAAGIALEMRVEPDLPRLDVDVGQVEQAFLSLVSNAVDAMPGGGTLVLSGRAAEGKVELAVADDGAGIAPEHLGRVFDPLFTTKPRGKGTGLGLFIVRDLVEAQGGSVAIASVPGRGTTVTLRLPLDEHA
jgi:signal transduction histidine kinase